MKKTIIKNVKKGKGLTKTFAFGGIEFNNPQEALFAQNQNVVKASYDTMKDNGLQNARTLATTLGMVGNMMKSVGAAGGELDKLKPGQKEALKFSDTLSTATPALTQLYQAKDLAFATGGMILPEYGDGGTITINSKNTDKFTKSASNAGMSVQDFASYILSNTDKYSPLQIKRANFARNAARWKHASGGEVETPSINDKLNIPVEVEGNEVGELPNGQMMQFNGPSHENGGIPVSLPEGTGIYSDRVSIDGKTMAKRKVQRERTKTNLEKKISEGDYVAKSTLDRYMLTSSKEEQLDMSIQQLLNQQDKSSVDRKAKGGKVVGTSWVDGLNDVSDGVDINGKLKSKPIDYSGAGISQINTEKDPLFSEQKEAFFNVKKDPLFSGVKIAKFYDQKDSDGNAKKDSEDSKFWSNIFDSTPTVGDLVGMYGNLHSAYAGKKNTLANRLGDTPNINPYEQYGKEGLKTLDESRDFIKQAGDMQRSEIGLSRNTAMKQNRETARSINTMRALDLATQANADRLDMNTYQSEVSQLANMMGKKADLQNQRDSFVMKGEQERDLADRQDRDSFYNSLVKDEQSIGQGLTVLGGSVNDIKERNASMEALNNIYGNFKTTKDGKIVGVPGGISLKAPYAKTIKNAFDNPESVGLTKDEPKKWTEAQMHTFLQSGIKPKTT